MRLSHDLTRLAAEEIRQLSPAVPLREDIAGRIRASGPLSALQSTATFTTPSGQVVTSTVANLKREKPEAQGSLELKEFVVDRVLALSGVKRKVNAQVAFKGDSLDDAQTSLQNRVSSLAFQEW